MHIFCALEQLLHVKLDLARRELDAFVLQEPGKVVIHVREDHVHRKWFFSIACIVLVKTWSAYDSIRTLYDEHVIYIDDIWMVERLQDLNLPQRGDGHALLLVVHENALERHRITFGLMHSFVHLTEQDDQSDVTIKHERGWCTHPNVPSPSLVITS